MANQTIAQLPYDLSSADSLNRFLRELVDNLDEILGYKGTNRYVKDSDFKEQGQTLEETTKQSQSNATTLESLQTTIKNQVDELFDLRAEVDKLNTLLTAAQLDTVYRDFDHSAWGELQGKGEFIAMYSELKNAPISATGDIELHVYVDSTKTAKAVWQVVYISYVDDGKEGMMVYSRMSVGGAWVTFTGLN